MPLIGSVSRKLALFILVSSLTTISPAGALFNEPLPRVLLYSTEPRVIESSPVLTVPEAAP
jgi:hypothetical protein